MRRLVPRVMPPDGSSLGTQKQHKISCVVWRQFIVRQAISGKILETQKFDLIRKQARNLISYIMHIPQ